MTASRNRHASLRYVVGGVIAATLLAGCAVASASPRSDKSAADAEIALAKGKVDKAIALGEIAVSGDPRNAAFRLILARAYLKAGRFDSAAMTYNDAMTLGDNNAKTALALALADVASGRFNDAVALLDDWRDSIPASDTGLALALAGQTARGVALLSDAIRSGDNTAKTRQNLAYAYALDGRWREARLMMAQDVPANEIDNRIGEWAARAQPAAFQARVAALLGTPLRADSGQPATLALAAMPVNEQHAAEQAAAAPGGSVVAAPVQVATPVVAVAELPAAVLPIAEAAPVPVPHVAVEAAPVVATSKQIAAAPVDGPQSAPKPSFAAAFVASPITTALGFVAQPVIQVAQSMIAPSVVAVRAAPRARVHSAVQAAHSYQPAAGTHLVQLGSFSSVQGARRAWGIYTARNHALSAFRMAIIPATVNGKNYWRVAASGIDRAGANSLCSSVKNHGGACLAYAASRAGAPMMAMGLDTAHLARR